jgi:hypothetical protein
MYHPFAFNKQDIRIISTPSITSASIDFLVVGGGGAGGYRTGGGGGAGGYITSQGVNGGNQLTLNPFTASMGVAYQISIGGGGAAFNTDEPSGITGNGTYSRFDVYLAEGGGRGGSGNNISGSTPVKLHIDGQPGGSGGGGGSWQYNALYATGSGGTGSAYYGGPYGYNGGSGSVGTGFRRGGGGGGANEVGENTLTGSSYLLAGANGGDGLSSGPEQTPIYRAGGGGGGQTATGGAPVTASGGLGGGGNGGTTGTIPGNGLDQTGGGGGGGGASAYIVGGKGGKGVIILRYNKNQITASVTAGVTASEVIPGGGVFKVLTVTAGAPGDTITFTPI